METNSSVNPEMLNEIFQQEIPLVQEFLQLLEQENDILQNFRTEGLNELTTQKNNLLSQIEVLENQRKNALNLSAESFSNNKQFVMVTNSLIAQMDNYELSNQWELLCELSKSVQEMNAKNGNLLAMRMNQTNQILKILQHRSDDPTLYGKQGLTCGRKGGRIADEA